MTWWQALLVALAAPALGALSAWVTVRATRPKISSEAAKLAEEAEAIGLANLRDLLHEAATGNAAKAAQIARLEEQVRDLQAQLVAQAQLEQEAQARRHERDNEVAALVGQIQLDHERAKREHQAAMAALREEYHAEVARLKVENAQLHAELAEARREIARLSASVEAVEGRERVRDG